MLKNCNTLINTVKKYINKKNWMTVNYGNNYVST